jgi:hypothetical protein
VTGSESGAGAELVPEVVGKPEIGAALAHVGGAADIAERPAVDSNVDKPADKGQTQDTAGSIADTVADTTVLGLAPEQEPQQ